MKFIDGLPLQALESMSRNAWRKKCGGYVNPENTTQFLCHIQSNDDKTEFEMHIRPEDEQHFSPAERAMMRTNQRIIPTLPDQALGN